MRKSGFSQITSKMHTSTLILGTIGLVAMASPAPAASPAPTCSVVPGECTDKRLLVCCTEYILATVGKYDSTGVHRKSPSSFLQKEGADLAIRGLK